jgi:hypothetical protein
MKSWKITKKQPEALSEEGQTRQTTVETTSHRKLKIAQHESSHKTVVISGFSKRQAAPDPPDEQVVLLLSQTHTVICHERERDGIYPWSFATQT